jgi:uncharacterized protein with PIN domain
VTRLLCDEMLRGLGRWLRAAGYDTVIAKGGLPDRTLAERRTEEDRVLLTKDRDLAATVAASAAWWFQETASTKPPRPYAPSVSTGNTRCSSAA